MLDPLNDRQSAARPETTERNIDPDFLGGVLAQSRLAAWIGRGGIMVGEKLISVGGSGTMVIGVPSPAGFKQLTKGHFIGKEVWNIPAYADGKLYVRTDKGDVVCARISE